MNANANLEALASVRISGVNINIGNMAQTIYMAQKRLESGDGFSIFTVNLDHIVKLRHDKRFRHAYSRSDFVAADGWPIVWAARRKGVNIERTTGADMVDPLCALAAQKGYGVYFIGPGQSAQTKALAILQARHPGLRIVGAEAPQIDPLANLEQTNLIAQRLKESGARLCIVSLGAPKQEQMCLQLRNICPNVGFAGVGAALDFIAGEIHRAPVFMQRARLEWLWRLVREPGRLGSRYFHCLYIFILLALERDPISQEMWRDA